MATNWFLAGVLVIVGIAWALPRAVAFLYSRESRRLRGPLLRASLATLLALSAFLLVLAWSRSLDSAQRNGHDAGYEIAFVAFGLAAALALALWTGLAVRVARAIELPPSAARIERRLALAVSACMGVMLIATAVWWGALAHAAPWALQDDPAGAAAPLVTGQLLIAGILMAAATATAAAGAVHALRAGRLTPEADKLRS